MSYLPVGWEYEHAIGVDAVRYCGCPVDWRHLAAPIPTEEVAHVQATGLQRREMSPVELRLVELGVTDSLGLNRRAFPENHGLNR